MSYFVEGVADAHPLPHSTQSSRVSPIRQLLTRELKSVVDMARAVKPEAIVSRLTPEQLTRQ